jgi:ABC-type glucose/galactose transport system permease subunit
MSAPPRSAKPTLLSVASLMGVLVQVQVQVLAPVQVAGSLVACRCHH